MARRSVKDMAFHEVFKRPPGIVKRTARKYGKARARKQQIAIAINKTRKHA